MVLKTAENNSNGGSITIRAFLDYDFEIESRKRDIQIIPYLRLLSQDKPVLIFLK